MNILETDLENLGVEKLLIIIYNKMRLGKSLWCLDRVFMQGKLEIIVSDEHTVRVEYKHKKFLLPEQLDTMFDDILVAVDYKEDVASVVYTEIEKRVNEMLAEYCIDKGMDMCTGFKFPPHPINIVPRINVSSTSGSIGAMPSYSDYRMATWNQADALRVLTSDEYETLMREGRLNSGEIYMVLN